MTAVGRHDRKGLPANSRSMHAKPNKPSEVNCVAVKYIFLNWRQIIMFTESIQ